MVDTHCHLDMDGYQDDFAGVLKRAKQCHVKNIITIGIDLSSSKRAVQLAQSYKQITAAIGTHPHDVANMTDETYQKLEQLYTANRTHIVGYGEIGLDYVKQHSPPEVQREHFEKQLELAARLKLPVIIHNREADHDTLDILKRAAPLEAGGIMHCFSGDCHMAKKIMDLGMLISIPGIVTFKNAKKLMEVAATIPLSKMVLETDGPFLAPTPFRGKRNEPAYVGYTAARVAELRNTTTDRIARVTTDNAYKLFNLRN
ncbi:TatD family hydrolase [Desulforhopalus singaporensis]|uniref:TatD family hydrolase n=1 Tax=Desulforhopalus singaporensis TaxID=91360 RepID=UPI001FDFC2E3|nr:TatD family hydrolase [Desulforhopalus singaporensis]